MLSLREASAVDPAERYPVAPLAVTDRGGETGFELDYLSERQRRRGSDEVRFSNLSLEEYVRFGFDGYAYHPRLLDFRTRFKVGFLQQTIERSGGRRDDDGKQSFSTFLSEYDVYLNFLKEHPFSLALFARRERRGQPVDHYVRATTNQNLHRRNVRPARFDCHIQTFFFIETLI